MAGWAANPGQIAALVGGEQDAVTQSGALVAGLQPAQIGLVVAERAIFVFQLHRDDRPAILQEQRLHLLPQPHQPAVDGGGIFGIGRTQHELAVLEQPGGIAAQFPFGADIGSGAQDHVQPLGLGVADEGDDVVLAAEVIDAGTRLMHVPEGIGGDGVQPHRLGLAQPVAPIGARDAGIVHLAGDHLMRLAVAQEPLALHLEGPGRAVIGDRALRRHTLRRKGRQRAGRQNCAQGRSNRSHHVTLPFILSHFARTGLAPRTHPRFGTMGAMRNGVSSNCLTNERPLSSPVRGGDRREAVVEGACRIEGPVRKPLRQRFALPPPRTGEDLQVTPPSTSAAPSLGLASQAEAADLIGHGARLAHHFAGGGGGLLHHGGILLRDRVKVADRDGDL